MVSPDHKPIFDWIAFLVGNRSFHLDPFRERDAGGRFQDVFAVNFNRFSWQVFAMFDAGFESNLWVARQIVK